MSIQELNQSFGRGHWPSVGRVVCLVSRTRHWLTACLPTLMRRKQLPQPCRDVDGLACLLVLSSSIARRRRYFQAAATRDYRRTPLWSEHAAAAQSTTSVRERIVASRGDAFGDVCVVDWQLLALMNAAECVRGEFSWPVLISAVVCEGCHNSSRRSSWSCALRPANSMLSTSAHKVRISLLTDTLRQLLSSFCSVSSHILFHTCQLIIFIIFIITTLITDHSFALPLDFSKQLHLRAIIPYHELNWTWSSN